MMKEFEMNENEMNEKMPEEMGTVNNDTTENTADTTPAAEPTPVEESVKTEDTVEPIRFETTPQPQEQPAPQTPNDGTYAFTRENIPNATYRPQPQNNNPYGAYAQNPQNPSPQYGNNPYGGYAPNPNQPPQNNPYGARPNPGFTNAYAPQNNPYYGNGMAQGDGQISYGAPDKRKKKKEKKSGSMGRGAIALVCALTVVASGLCGFAGTAIANKMNAGNTPSAPVIGQGGTAVVYRTVEDVVSSTGTPVGENLNYSQVAALVKDSVVEIMTEYTVQSMWYQYVTGGAGSGVIISDDGYIVTNNHVICDDSGSNVAETITVRLTNGEEYKASVIGNDVDSNIAVLKIEAENLTFAVAGNSDNLAVGEEVVVVGNPLGELGGTVTNGIVSSTEREMEVNGVTMSLIQSNAAVNPGNSGGGMFNMKGELIGIVNAKSSGTGIEGLGFAIPINEALRTNEQLLEFGYVRGKVMIGVSFSEISNSSTFMYYYNLKPGVYVASLSEGYNDKVLMEGDRVIAVNGNEISTTADIKAIVTSSAVGDKLTFQLYREGKLIEVEVTCYEQVPESVSGNVQFEEGKGNDASDNPDVDIYPHRGFGD